MNSSPPEPERVAARWLRWADEDLTLAQHAAVDAEVVARGACVWAHQAAEKALKALLAHHDIDPPRLHDLDRLVQRAPAEAQVGFGALELPELTRWAIDGRYPADVDEATGADAVKSIEIAKAVMELVRSRLASDSGPPAGEGNTPGGSAVR